MEETIKATINDVFSLFYEMNNKEKLNERIIMYTKKIMTDINFLNHLDKQEKRKHISTFNAEIMNQMHNYHIFYSSNIFTLTGISLILFSVFFFNDGSPYPNYKTLIPVVGTALIIFFSSKNNYISKVLSSRVFVGVGLISYSVYLWHFPIFAFYRNLKPTINNGTTFYDTKNGKGKRTVDWKVNRAVFFSRIERKTWHSYAGDERNNRIVLVYNLMTNKIKEVYNIEQKSYLLGQLRYKLNPYIYRFFKFTI